MSGVELLGGLRQPVFDEIGNRRNVKVGLKKVKRAAFADGSSVRNHLEANLLGVMVMDVLHHCLQLGLGVAGLVQAGGIGIQVQMTGQHLPELH